jgi:hypothetical protein
MTMQEANITEILFLPRSAKAKVQKKTQASSHTQSSLGRSRISIRQREKEEKRLAQQRKKEATIAMAGMSPNWYLSSREFLIPVPSHNHLFAVLRLKY